MSLTLHAPLNILDCVRTIRIYLLLLSCTYEHCFKKCYLSFFPDLCSAQQALILLLCFYRAYLQLAQNEPLLQRCPISCKCTLSTSWSLSTRDIWLDWEEHKCPLPLIHTLSSFFLKWLTRLGFLFVSCYVFLNGRANKINLSDPPGAMGSLR